MKTINPNTTVRIYFSTVDSTGALVAPSAAFTASDFAIHKDGGSTEKTTTNGITVTSPFDSVTGLHLIEIDTSNDTGDSDFWKANSNYIIRFSTAKTVDSIAVTGMIVPNSEFVLKYSNFNFDMALSPSNLNTAKFKPINSNSVNNGYTVIINPSGNITSKELP